MPAGGSLEIPVRILFLNDYADLADAPAFQLDKLRRAVCAAGHETLFLATNAPFSKQPDFAESVRCKGFVGRLQTLSQTVNPFAYAMLRRTLAEFRPHIVHIRMFMWQLSPTILSLLEDVPVVFQASIYKAVCPTGRKILPSGAPCSYPAGAACLREKCLTPQSWALMMAQRALLARWRHRIDRTVTLSDRMKSVFEACGWPVDAVIPNGVDLRAARPPLVGPPTIGYAGRLDREKGIFVLIDAIARLRDRLPGVKLKVLGDGPDRARAAEAAAAAGIDAHFYGFLPREDMEAVLGDVWVQAVPSLWEEPFGNVTTEAMMRGAAVVASAVGGQIDIVADGETGRLTPPGDAAALAEAVRVYLEDRALAEAHGAAGRKRVLRSFTNEAVRDAYLLMYETMLADNARGKAASQT